MPSRCSPPHNATWHACRRLAESQPELLAAHSYVRYLGDLSGGQILARIVRESMAFRPGQGTAFYAFGDAAATADLRKAYRAGLVALRPENELAVRAIVDVGEARVRAAWPVVRRAGAGVPGRRCRRPMVPNGAARRTVPDPSNPHPMEGFPQVCFIKNTVRNPNIIVGDYTYYDDPEDSENFERNVLYHFPFIGDKLVIGKFCALAPAGRSSS